MTPTTLTSFFIFRPAHVLIAALIFYSIFGAAGAEGNQTTNSDINLTTTTRVTPTVPPTTTTTMTPTTTETPAIFPTPPVTNSTPKPTTPVTPVTPIALKCVANVLKNCTLSFISLETGDPCTIDPSRPLQIEVAPQNCTSTIGVFNVTVSMVGPQSPETTTAIPLHNTTTGSSIIVTTESGGNETTTTVKPAPQKGSFHKAMIYLLLAILALMVCQIFFKVCSANSYQKWDEFKTHCAIARSDIRAWYVRVKEDGWFSRCRSARTGRRPVSAGTGLLNNDYEMF